MRFVLALRPTPDWSRDSKEIIYVHFENNKYSAQKFWNMMKEIVISSFEFGLFFMSLNDFLD